MKESELVERLQRLYANPIPESCRMAMMDYKKASNHTKKGWRFLVQWSNSVRR